MNLDGIATASILLLHDRRPGGGAGERSLDMLENVTVHVAATPALSFKKLQCRWMISHTEHLLAYPSLAYIPFRPQRDRVLSLRKSGNGGGEGGGEGGGRRTHPSFER